MHSHAAQSRCAQAQAKAHALDLGGEKRGEKLVFSLRVDACAAVDHAKYHPALGQFWRMHLCRALVSSECEHTACRCRAASRRLAGLVGPRLHGRGTAAHKIMY